MAPVLTHFVPPNRYSHAIWLNGNVLSSPWQAAGQILPQDTRRRNIRLSWRGLPASGAESTWWDPMCLQHHDLLWSLIVIDSNSGNSSSCLLIPETAYISLVFCTIWSIYNFCPVDTTLIFLCLCSFCYDTYVWDQQDSGSVLAPVAEATLPTVTLMLFPQAWSSSFVLGAALH